MRIFSSLNIVFIQALLKLFENPLSPYGCKMIEVLPLISALIALLQGLFSSYDTGIV